MSSPEPAHDRERAETPTPEATPAAIFGETTFFGETIRFDEPASSESEEE